MKIRVKVKAKTLPEKKPEEVKIKGDFIQLDALLKFVNAVDSGGVAKMMIQNAEVTVNGEICTQRGRKIRPSDIVRLGTDAYRIIKEDADM